MPQRAPNKPKASSFRRKNDVRDDIFEVFDEQEQDLPPLEPSATISKSESLIIAIDLMKNPARDAFKKLKESVFLPSDEQIKKNSYFKNELGKYYTCRL